MCGHVRELLLPYAPPLKVVPYSVPSMRVSPAGSFPSGGLPKLCNTCSSPFVVRLEIRRHCRKRRRFQVVP